MYLCISNFNVQGNFNTLNCRFLAGSVLAEDYRRLFYSGMAVDRHTYERSTFYVKMNP